LSHLEFHSEIELKSNDLLVIFVVIGRLVDQLVLESFAHFAASASDQQEQRLRLLSATSTAKQTTKSTTSRSKVCS